MTPARVLFVVILNQRRELARLREQVGQFAESCGLSTEDVNSTNLALDEIVSNVIEHGYDDTLEHEISITMRFEGDLLTIGIEDDGRPFNPLAEPLPDVELPLEERPIGGLGILLVRSMADGLDYRRERGRNILRIEKRIPRDDKNQAAR